MDPIDRNLTLMSTTTAGSVTFMARKRRKDAYLITYQGETRTITEWSRATGIARNTIRIRLERLGWTTERALTEKPQPRDTSQSNLDAPQSERRKRRRQARRESGLCIECKKPAGGFYACEKCRQKRSAYRKANKQSFKSRQQRYLKEKKQQVFEHYGTECECCGESHIDFLTLDHPNDDGAKHRSEVGSGSRFYGWLIKNDFPADYELRTLCFNCNQGRRVNGGVCPHQILKES